MVHQIDIADNVAGQSKQINMFGKKLQKLLSSTDLVEKQNTFQKGLASALSADDLEEDKMPEECTDKNNFTSLGAMNSVLCGVRPSLLSLHHGQTSSNYRHSRVVDYLSTCSETATTCTGMEEDTSSLCDFEQGYASRCKHRSIESGYCSQNAYSQNISFSDLPHEFERLKLNPHITESMTSSVIDTDEEHRGYCSVCENTRLSAHGLEIYKQDTDGDNLLHMSIIQGTSDYIFYGISVAPDSDWLNITNNLLQTALHLAVITKQLPIVRRLMVGGADITILDDNGNTPLHIACKQGFTEIARTLLKPVTYEELHQNEYDIAYQKIPQDLNVKNYDGQSCLHLATECSHVDIIKLLLSRGANVNARDGKSGRTVLHYATECTRVSIIELLITVPELDIDAETYGGETSVMLALGRNQEKIANMLIQHGAKIQLMQQDDVSDDDISDDFYDVLNTFS